MDDGSYGSTGDQPTYAGKKTSLTAVAKACGCKNVVECAAEEIVDVLTNAIDSDQMTVILCKCESGNIPVPVIMMDPVEIRCRFMRAVSA
ncbi:MAG: sulfopyruvate decarboxylase subunit beta [Gammaproteobacteria bacterium]|jgi:sulfopyruvate decarboxylase subunit beta